MSDTTLIQRLSDEADLCRNDGATDVAKLLDDAVYALVNQAAQIAEGDAGIAMWAAEVDALRSEIKTQLHQLRAAKTTIAEKDAEIVRLKSALKRQEDREGRIGTHSPDCHTWGPSHYDCALRRIEVLRAALENIAKLDHCSPLIDARAHARAALRQEQPDHIPTGGKMVGQGGGVA